MAGPYRPITSAIWQFCDENGVPYAGGSLYTYAAGTTTLQATYATSSGTANANPVVLDSAGRATIYLDLLAYKFILFDVNSVQVWSQDNIGGSPSMSADGLTWTGGLTTTVLVDLSASTAGQIKFPGTPNTSSNANTLDAYGWAAWTPVAVGLTVSSGSATLSGSYVQIGSLVFWRLTVTPPSGQTTSATAGTTYFTGLPLSPAATSLCSAADDGAVSHGNGIVGSSGATHPGAVYPPAWTTVGSAVELSGVFSIH